MPTQKDKFEIAIFTNFAGVFFLLLLPLVMGMVNLYVPSSWYKVPGIVCLCITAILFILTQDYFKKQMMIFGIDFLIFGLVQFMSPYIKITTYSAFLLSVIFFTWGLWLHNKEHG